MLSPLSLPFFALILLSIYLPSEAACPAPAAFELPIRNVSLPKNASRRGVPISVGSPGPGQTLAFQLSCELNNTYIFDVETGLVSDGCSSSDRTKCIGKYGGLFQDVKSLTWSQPTDNSMLSTVAENPLINPNHTADLWGTDIFALTSEKNISDFPLGISRAKGESMNTLGLGRNSSLLNALVDNEIIAAKIFGFWRGWTSAELNHQVNGGLVLGGYDAAKITGPNITLPTSAVDNLNADCFLATITDIRMNLRNGSSPSLFGANRATLARACVEPHFDTLSLPLAMWESFLSISGSTYVNRSNSAIAFYGMLIEADGAYDGDLTISIDPGLDITIPNHQLVVPDYDINSNGQTFVKNESNREVLIGSLQQINQNDMLVLGAPFFTSAYMMVDNDRKQFTLWKSQPTAKSKLIAMPAHDCENPNTTVNTPPSSTPTIAGITIEHTSNSRGSIVGAVVGGLAGIAMLALAIAFLLKRKRAKRNENKHAKFRISSRPVTPILYKPELASDRQPPQELPGSQESGQGISHYENSEDRSHQELYAQGFVPVVYEMSVATQGQGLFEMPGLSQSPKSVRKLS